MSRRTSNVETSTNDSPDDDFNQRIPSIEEQLKNIQPSRELLDYYRSRLKLHEKEYRQLVEKLNKCKLACEETHVSEAELAKQNDKVFTLQETLSDLQNYLHRERSQVLKLQVDNDGLRIKLAEDRKKIAFLIRLCGVSDHQVHYLMNRSNVVDPIVKTQKRVTIVDDSAPSDESEPEKDAEILILKVSALNAELGEIMQASQDEILSLHQDRELILRERREDHTKLQKQIKKLTDRLNKTRVRLCSATKELIEIKQEYHKKEEGWLLEKEKLISKKKSTVLIPDCIRKAPEKEMLAIKEQLKEKDCRIKLYKDKCASLEKDLWDLNHAKEESYNLWQEKMEKLSIQLHNIKEKYQILCRRRAQENEGFRNDVKILKEKMHSLERKYLRSQHSAQVPQRKELIETAKITLTKARAVHKELKQLDNKLKDFELDEGKNDSE